MPHVSLAIADKNYPCRSLEGVERLGEATDLRIEVVLPEAVERGAWLGQPCSVVRKSDHRERSDRTIVNAQIGAS